MMGSVGAVPREPQPASKALVWVPPGTEPRCFGLKSSAIVQFMADDMPPTRYPHRITMTTQSEAA
jgi:hypothetical protein